MMLADQCSLFKKTTKAAEIRNLHCGITHPLRTGGTWQCLTFKMGSMDMDTYRIYKSKDLSF